MTTPGATAGTAARHGHAAEHLFTRYRDQIYRFCYTRLRSREEAEDAVQNVFLRVHTALQRGVVPEYEAAWLYKIAHNVCLSRHDSTARRARVETPHALDDDDIPVPAPEVVTDELAGLSEALHAMPPKLRTAIVLREWQGLSYAEIAEAMETTVPAVETLIFRARRHLAAALEQGTPTPKRTVAARILDFVALRALLGRLRSLFGGAASAKVATGAALVAVAGGGLGTAVALSKPVHSQAPAGLTIRLPAGVTGSFGARPRAGAQPAAVAARHAAPVAAASPLAPAYVAPASEPAPAVLSPVVVPPPPTTAPATTAAVQPAPSAQPAPVPSVPTVSVPTVAATPTPPSVSVPAVTTPTVDVPTVSAPATGTPTVPAATVTLPVVGGVAVGG